MKGFPRKLRLVKKADTDEVENKIEETPRGAPEEVEVKVEANNERPHITSSEKNKQEDESPVLLRAEPKKPYRDIKVQHRPKIGDTTAVVFVGAKGTPLETLMKQYASFRPDFVLGRRVTTIPEDEINSHRSKAEKFLHLEDQPLDRYVQYNIVQTKSGEEKTIGYDKFIFDVAATLDTGVLLSATPDEAEELYAFLETQKRLDVLTVYINPTAEEMTDKIAAKISKQRGTPVGRDEAISIYETVANNISEEKNTISFSEKADIIIEKVDISHFKREANKIDALRKERNPLSSLNQMMTEPTHAQQEHARIK